MRQRVRFEAREYCEDGSFHLAGFRFEGSPELGWSIERNDKPWLSLGPGYRMLRTVQCGVCSTDLARHYLPFPLPQVTGHEVLTVDESGRRHVVEINASHLARRVKTDCPFCASGLATHCPERGILGIHALPGGFGPFVLVPLDAAIPVPDELPSSTAVLVEPFAAALHAVTTIQPRAHDSVVVLGPRRLGLLVIAALAAHRDRTGVPFEIGALSRHPHLLEIARSLGSSRLVEVRDGGAELESGLADVVVDTTGSPAGLDLAIRLARREVHLKSTHGRPAAGLDHPTELVVDEISLEPFPRVPPSQRATPWLARADAPVAAHVAWLAPAAPPSWLDETANIVRREVAAQALQAIAEQSPGAVPQADAAVVSSARQIDDVIRPDPRREVSVVRPRGTILVLDDPVTEPARSPLVSAIVERELILSTSRCGSLGDALDVMRSDEKLRRLGDRMVTHRFAAADIAEAFEIASSPSCIKAVVSHGAEGRPPVLEELTYPQT